MTPLMQCARKRNKSMKKETWITSNKTINKISHVLEHIVYEFDRQTIPFVGGWRL